MVMPLRDYKRKGLTKNELYEVVGKTAEHLRLKAADGKVVEVNLDFKKAVFEREEIQIAVGDRLMWKKNNQALEQVNGEEVVVKGIDGSRVEIEEQDGKIRTIDLAQPHHLDHAIVRTTYSSQGETADRVIVAADSTIGKESFYVAASRARLELCFYTQNQRDLLEWALESKGQENPLELIRQQVKQKELELALKVSHLPERKTATESSQSKHPSPSTKNRSTVALPIKRTDSNQSPTPNVPFRSTVTSPIKSGDERRRVTSNQSQQPPVKRSTEKQTDMVVLKKSNAVEPKRAVQVEAFWTPGSVSAAPFNIDPAHWKELVEGSAIHPELVQRNIQTVAGNGVYDRLLSTRLEKIGGSGQYVTQPAAKLMKAYEQVAEGGWWAKSGIDARSLPNLKPGKQPELKTWGSFKANNPRVDAEKSQRKGNTEFIKYEHPLGEERQLFLFELPDALAERIYNLHNIQPSETEKQSGFWYVVYKHNLPITLTEGAKKTLSSLSQGKITVGFSGVNGGYTTRDQDKNRLDQRLLHPELRVFATPGREFRFAFDHDTKLSTIFNVRRELVRTGELLEQEGCNVQVVQWQDDKGLDDLIVNQGPFAYAQAHSNAIPLNWEARKHYRSEYTRLARQVRNSQSALTSEAVDVEVYKLAISKGDIRDGARAICQSDQARSFKAELLSEEVHAKTLAYIQHIEQQIYQPLIAKAKETRQDEPIEQQQVSSVQQPTGSLTQIAQELAVAMGEAVESQQVEVLVEAITPLVQRLAERQSPTASLAKAVASATEQLTLEAAAPDLALAVQTLSQSLISLRATNRSISLTALSEQVQSLNTPQQEQSDERRDQPVRTSNRQQLSSSDVRGNFSPGRAHQASGADPKGADRSHHVRPSGANRNSHTVTRELSEGISSTIELQEAQSLAGSIEGLNRSLAQYKFSAGVAKRSRGGTERLRGAIERYHASINERLEHKTGQLINATTEHVELTGIESASFTQALENFTLQLNQVQSLGTNSVVQQLNTAITGAPEQVGNPPLSVVESKHTTQQLIDTISNHIEETTIESALLVQALEAVTGKLHQNQLEADHTSKAVDRLNQVIAAHQQPIEPSSTNLELGLQPSQQLLNAISAHVEAAALDSEPFVQALQSVSAQLQNPETIGTIQGFDKAISEHLPEIEQQPVVPSGDQTTQQLVDAIVKHVEQETIDVSPVSTALKELRVQLNQFQANKITRAVEDLDTAISGYRQLAENPETVPIDQQRTVRELAEAISNNIEQVAIEVEPVTYALQRLTEQLKQLPPVEITQAENSLNTVVADYLQQMKVQVVGIHQQTTKQLAAAISDYVEYSLVDSEQVAQAVGKLATQMHGLQPADPTKSIEELNAVISSYRQLTEKPGEVAIEREQTAKGLAEAIANHFEQGAVESEAIVQALQNLTEQLEQLPTERTTQAAEKLNTIASDYLLQQAKALSVGIQEQTTKQLVEVISDYVEHASVSAEQIALAIERMVIQTNGLQTSDPTNSIEQLRVAISNYIHKIELESRNQIQQAEPSVPTDTTLEPIMAVADEREWVRIKTARPQVEQYNNEVGVVVGRIRVAGSVQVMVQIGKYTPGFDNSELEPINSPTEVEIQHKDLIDSNLVSQPEPLSESNAQPSIKIGSTNAVFLHSTDTGEITGASLRGVAEDSHFKGLATGSRKEQGWFTLSQGQGPLERILLTESPIDAMSAAAIAKSKSGTTMFIATDGTGAAPIDLLRQHQAAGVQIMVAQDADRAGEEMAWKIAQVIPAVTRSAPAHGKDWNEQLLGQAKTFLDPFEWKRVAQALGKSEAYINRIAAVLKSGDPLPEQGLKAMQQDFNAYKQASSDLWQWHMAAKTLGKSEAYQKRIADVAIAFHHPTQPSSLLENVVVTMQRDLSQYEQQLTQKLWQHYSQNADPNRPMATAGVVAYAAMKDGHLSNTIHQILEHDPQLIKIKQRAGEEATQNHIKLAMRKAEYKVRSQKQPQQHNQQCQQKQQTGLQL